MFAGEVVIVLAILVLARRIADAPVTERPKLDLVGVVLSALGLGLFVFGILRTSEWGWIQPKPDGPSWGGVSPSLWLMLGGVFVIWIFFRWETRMEEHGEPLLRADLLRNKQLSGGLAMFFMSPRLVTRCGLLALLVGTCVLLATLDPSSGPEVVFVPLLLIGLGIGALASQLGAVTVSAVPDERSPEVGGVQNTMTNLGASIGTALAGSVMIAAVSSAFLGNIQDSSTIPDRVKSQAQVQLAGGVPFVSDADLEHALDEAHVSRSTTSAALDAYGEARISGLTSSLAVLAIIALGGLFVAQRIPQRQPQ